MKLARVFLFRRYAVVSQSAVALVLSAGACEKYSGKEEAAKTSETATTAADTKGRDNRWLIVLNDRTGTVLVDTTRIIRTGPSSYKIWEVNSSDVLSLEELDCSTLQEKLLQYEEFVGKTQFKTLIHSKDSSWFELPPGSRGEGAARATCRYLNSR